MTRRKKYRFSIGQRVYLVGSGEPVVVVDMWFDLQRRMPQYRITHMDGRVGYALAANLTDRKPSKGIDPCGA